MTGSIIFSSADEYRARRGDTAFWRPWLKEIFRRHDLKDGDPVSGIGGTYPTFICGELVVKLFGFNSSWRVSLAAERAAYEKLAAHREIAAPLLIAKGQMFDGQEPWPYLVTSRMPGVFWDTAGMNCDRKLAAATDLGRQIGALHALKPSGVATHEDWPVSSVPDAARRSSLPEYFVGQIDGFLAGFDLFDRTFVHGDLMHRHVFIEDGRFSGIIDWGDAMITDRYYELAKLHLDLFNCDKALLRAFLDASDWPMAAEFPQKALCLALWRQAQGLAQHPLGMDVFHKLPTVLPVEQIATLDELAQALFAV